MDKNKKIIYIGKAKSLKTRVSSYFLKNLIGKTKTMMHKSKYLTFITVNSEIESLLLESNLISKIKPQYNLELRDDKSPLYIKITKDKYPRVITARKSEKNDNSKYVFGPFPSGGNVKEVLGILRKIFPYSTHRLGKRPCIHSQIGLCDPCPNLIEKTGDYELRKDYLRNINYIKRFLQGNFVYIKKGLIKEMDDYSKAENFERARELRQKLQKIEYITQPVHKIDEYVKDPNHLSDIRKKELENLKAIINIYNPLLLKLNRIECYDVAHLQGSFPTASMVTFINGEPDKTLYRRFKINQEKKNSDTDSLEEVAKRRKNRIKDWGKPDLIIVDGGKGQVTSFIKIFNDTIPIVGIAKREETLIFPNFKDEFSKFKQKKLRGEALNLVQRLRNEAHRFSRSYHHKLVEKQILDTVN